MKTKFLIIVGLIIAIGAITTILAVEIFLGQLDYKEKVGGLKDTTTSVSISDPLCLTTIAASGEKGSAASMENCIPLKQLEEIGCTYQILEHISQYTNMLDEEFDGMLYREWIGLPQGITEEEYKRCLEFLLERRVKFNETESVDDTVRHCLENKDAMIIIPEIGNATHYFDYKSCTWNEQKVPMISQNDSIKIAESLDVESEEAESLAKKSGFQVKVSGTQQVRGGTTHEINVLVTRDGNPVNDAQIRLTIEDYGEDILREFKGRTDSNGRFVFSWEAPKFEDVKTLLAYIDATDNISAKTALFKFSVYCLPGEAGCKIDGN